MGIASIIGGPRDFRFRIDPVAMEWEYNLNTAVKNTYGGRVIQIVSANLTTLTVTTEAGWGGYPYRYQFVVFCKTLATQQRDNGKSVTFNYSPRGISLKVFFSSIQLSNAVDDVQKRIQIQFEIEEDLNGNLKKSAMTSALKRIREGVGFTPEALSDTSDDVKAQKNTSNNNSGGGGTGGGTGVTAVPDTY